MTVSKIAACVALALLLAACAQERASRSAGEGYEMESERNGPILPPDPTRKVSDQDCTRQIEMDGGNLRCR